MRMLKLLGATLTYFSIFFKHRKKDARTLYNEPIALLCYIGRQITFTTAKSWGGTLSYRRLYGDVPQERGTFFKIIVYETIGISLG